MALNAIEMLVNCIELYLGKQRNPISKNYALYAIGMLKDSLDTLASSKDVTEDMRFTLQEVGATAGIAISSSAGGMSLALANAISDVAKVNRNETLAIVFPAFLKYYLSAVKDEYEEILQYGFTREQFMSINKEDRANVFVYSVKTLVQNVLQKYNLPKQLSELGVVKEQFDEIAQISSIDSALLDSPMWFDKVDLVKILEECYNE